MTGHYTARQPKLIERSSQTIESSPQLSATGCPEKCLQGYARGCDLNRGGAWFGCRTGGQCQVLSWALHAEDMYVYTHKHIFYLHIYIVPTGRGSQSRAGRTKVWGWCKVGLGLWKISLGLVDYKLGFRLVELHVLAQICSYFSPSHGGMHATPCKRRAGILRAPRRDLRTPLTNPKLTPDTSCKSTLQQQAQSLILWMAETRSPPALFELQIDLGPTLNWKQWCFCWWPSPCVAGVASGLVIVFGSNQDCGNLLKCLDLPHEVWEDVGEGPWGGALRHGYLLPLSM